VEDDAQVRELAGRTLAAHGYEVLEAATAEEALALARTHPGEILLLITDMVMPKMTGRELAGRIAVLRPATRTLFMSGYSGRAIVHQGVLESDSAFLAKPFTPESLIEKVRDVICRA
jgi:CheY-like chemotaxis protein